MIRRWFFLPLIAVCVIRQKIKKPSSDITTPRIPRQKHTHVFMYVCLSENRTRRNTKRDRANASHNHLPPVLCWDLFFLKSTAFYNFSTRVTTRDVIPLLMGRASAAVVPRIRRGSFIVGNRNYGRTAFIRLVLWHSLMLPWRLYEKCTLHWDNSCTAKYHYISLNTILNRK